MSYRKFRIPRIWSNNELRKFSYLFTGKVVNVSGWKDIDKQGHKYKDYFFNASEYWITNYKSEARGFQGNLENEIFLDLSIPLDSGLEENFDVVFNHTVLEHIFELDTAYQNLCRLSKDIVIIVVPFLQEQHAAYGDYWRLSPQAVDKLFRKNGLDTLFINFNDEKDASIYVFAIGSKQPEKWLNIKDHQDNRLKDIYEIDIGKMIIRSGFIENIVMKIKKRLSKI